MNGEKRNSGINLIGDIPWGTHLCQFYQTKEDLIDILVPYFRAGLYNNEFCMWVTSEPLGVKEAKESLGKAVRAFDDYISKGQIEILDYRQWCIRSGKLNTEELLVGWIEKERKALEKGFGGLRLTGNTSWLGDEDWAGFREYEEIMDSVIGGHRMIAICTYPLDRCGAYEVLDIINNHEVTLIKRKGGWRTVESDERKRLKKLLADSEVRFRRLFETAQDGILILDADTGQIIEVNPFLKDLLGYMTEELLGKRLWEIGLFKDILKSEEAFRELQRERYIRYEDLQLETKDGRPVDVEFVSNVYDVDQNKIIQCNIRDIHKRKKAERVAEHYKDHLEKLVEQRTGALEKSNRILEQERIGHKTAEETLQQSENRYKTLFEEANDAILVADMETENIIDANKSAERLLGYSKKELIGMNRIKLHHSDKHDYYEQYFRDHAKAGHVVDSCSEVIRKDGTSVVVSISDVIVQIGDREVMLGLFRDMTEHKQLEEEQQKAVKMESVGTLAGGIAHDFNNMLTGIMGNISLAKWQLEPKSKAEERLLEAEKASVRARDLTQQLLTFSRGGAPVKNTVFIAGLFKESAVFALRGSNIRCDFNLPDNLWPVEVDKGQINQVITNIVINAQEAMPGGGVISINARNTTVRGRSTLPLSAGQYVLITIKDQGVGIEKEHLSKIFDPYFSTKQKGNGLGLATSYSIIKTHGGYIAVDSAPGVGTTFQIYLPASKELTTAATVEVEETDSEGITTGEGRILIMEDDEAIRKMLNAILRTIGYKTLLTTNGAEAIKKYTQAKKSGRPFDGVILDLTIPGGMGGKETIKKLLEIDPQAKAIVSSGYSTDPMMADYKKYGFSGIVIKPFSAAQIEKTLQSLLKKK